MSAGLWFGKNTNSGFSLSNIADIYANSAVTQRCQNRRLLPETSGAQACCHGLLPPSPLFMKVAANSLRRTSARLSCDHMLPQPSAQGQPALLPALSLPATCWLLHCMQGHLSLDPACSGPRRTQNVFVLPLIRITSPRVTEKTNKQKPSCPR